MDVPCFGLILFAKSFRAYYDLQVLSLKLGSTATESLIELALILYDKASLP